MVRRKADSVKILLDENLPHDLRHELPGHDVITVKYRGWNGIQNGRLLALAAQDGFDAFITMDNGVAYQQNIATLPVAVIMIRARSNDIDDLRPTIPELMEALQTIKPRTIARVGH